MGIKQETEEFDLELECAEKIARHLNRHLNQHKTTTIQLEKLRQMKGFIEG